MWHEERELAFQRRRGGKVLTGSSFKGRKGSRYTPHISSLFGDIAAASTFYLPPISSPFFFSSYSSFFSVFLPFVLLHLDTFLGTQSQRLAGDFWINLFQNNLWRWSFGWTFSAALCINFVPLWKYCCLFREEVGVSGSVRLTQSVRPIVRLFFFSF